MTLQFTYTDAVDGTTGISATLINNIGDTLQTLCNSVNKSATFVVAAYNSSTAEKNLADFVCDGVSDQAEVNAAINTASTLTAGGGTVLMLSGQYTIDNTIFVNSNTTLKGVGYATKILAHANLGTMYLIQTNGTTANNITISDLQIDGNKANQTNGQWGISTTNTCTNVIIENIYIHDLTGDGISLLGTSATNCRICKNFMTNMGNAAQGIVGDATTVQRNVIEGNIINSVSSWNAIDMQGTSSCIYNIISGNVISGSGITLDANCAYNLVSGNIVTGALNYGICISSTTAHDNSILGNVVYHSSSSTNLAYDNIFINGNYNNVQNNICRKGSSTPGPKNGINVYGGTGNLVTNNDLYDSGITNNYTNTATGTITAAGNRTT